MKPVKLITTVVARIIFISLALILFFSMMAGMYYKSAPRHIRLGIVDKDCTPLSRSIIYNIRASDYFKIVTRSVDYLSLRKQVDDGNIDVGVVIPRNAYKDVLNKRNVRILAVLNGTANPIIPKLSLMMLNKIVMTLNNQLAMKLRVEDLGVIPNVRHARKPLLMVSERVFYSPALSMESSMLPAFMGLAMQIVSMLIVLFVLLANFKMIKSKMKYIENIREMPVKVLVSSFIISWIIVSTAISTAFFTTMILFKVPFTAHVMYKTVFVISMFVASMESISFFIALIINNKAVIAALITLIVLPAFMYSGYLIPGEQMASVPKIIGGFFPLRYYLNALYPVFNHHRDLYSVSHQLKIISMYILAFLGLSLVFIVIGQRANKKRLEK